MKTRIYVILATLVFASLRAPDARVYGLDGTATAAEMKEGFDPNTPTMSLYLADQVLEVMPEGIKGWARLIYDGIEGDLPRFTCVRSEWAVMQNSLDLVKETMSENEKCGGLRSLEEIEMRLQDAWKLHAEGKEPIIPSEDIKFDGTVIGYLNQGPDRTKLDNSVWWLNDPRRDGLLGTVLLDQLQREFGRNLSGIDIPSEFGFSGYHSNFHQSTHDQILDLVSNAFVLIPGSFNPKIGCREVPEALTPAWYNDVLGFFIHIRDQLRTIRDAQARPV